MAAAGFTGAGTRPTFLRQTLIEWAGQTVLFCSWAKAYYEQQGSKRTGHHAVLRASAFKWLRIFRRCWHTHQHDSQETHLQQLHWRHSPIAARARQIALQMAAQNTRKHLARRTSEVALSDTGPTVFDGQLKLNPGVRCSRLVGLDVRPHTTHLAPTTQQEVAA